MIDWQSVGELMDDVRPPLPDVMRAAIVLLVNENRFVLLVRDNTRRDMWLAALVDRKQSGIVSHKYYAADLTLVEAKDAACAMARLAGWRF